MKRFNYKAKDKNGRLVTGEVEANDLSSAAKLINGKGLYVISISPKIDSPFAIIRRFRDRITSKDVTIFTRQLSTMINAGLPITEALLILRSQSKGAMQKIVAQILADVEAGESLSGSVAKHPKIFSPTYIALIKSGEVGGVMDAVLSRLAENMEKQQEFNSRVKGALIYPTIIVIGMVLVSVIMMIFVIPKLLSLYADFNATLPLPTRILIGISNFFIRFWPVVLVLGVGGYYLFKLYKATADGRRKIDELTFRIPIFGELQRQIILTELTRTLALMVGSGVPILEALTITSGVVGNTVISDALRDCGQTGGKGFSHSFLFRAAS